MHQLFFRALVNDDLRDMLNCFVFIYLDKILIFSPDEETECAACETSVAKILR